jgi:Family of unknown function (DUF6174)
MTNLTRRFRTRRYVKLSLAALLMATAGCGGGQEVTPESVQAAKQLWARAGIRDYDLDWSVTGPNNAHYLVTVRDGQVRTIEMIGRDGGKSALHPAETSLYSVDGLFRTLEEELAVCSKSETPFGQPKGSKVVMRFQPDGKQGYPHWYHRDVLGTPMSMSIDVNALTPIPAGPKTSSP